MADDVNRSTWKEELSWCIFEPVETFRTQFIWSIVPLSLSVTEVDPKKNETTQTDTARQDIQIRSRRLVDMNDSVEKSPEENVGEQSIEESIDEHMIQTGEEFAMFVANEEIDEKGK